MAPGASRPARGWVWLAVGLGLVGVLLLAGFWGQALWRDQVATERASATVVRVEGQWSSSRATVTAYCPVLRWSIGGETVERESPGCRDEESDFTVGETVAIRYDPHDESQVFLASWWSIYNLAVLVTPVAGFLLLLAWFLIHAYRYRLRVARGEIDPVAEARARAEKRRSRPSPPKG